MKKIVVESAEAVLGLAITKSGRIVHAQVHVRL